jgi:type II restriction/modification system DNA methylase subunit YeeA
VVKPWVNGSDLVQRPSDTWIVDFGVTTTEEEAALYEAPFAYILAHVRPEKMLVRAESEKRYWWLHARTAPDMRKALVSLDRYIATSIVAKHRLFVWLDKSVLSSHAVCAIARSDDTTFGILHSRFHELWSLRLGTSLEDRPRYTPTTTFETFPFPVGMSPRDTAQDMPSGTLTEAIAAAAKRLNELRENWLNPPEWVEWVRTPEEERAGFPPRPVAKTGFEVDLKKRTLTNLYNARPAWLDNAHKALDKAVAEAYGWTDYTPEMADEEILRRLLALNLMRSTG